MDARWWLLIGMIGPLGVMGLVRAIATFYDDRKRSREPELSFVSCDEVEAVEDTLVEILPRLFGVAYDQCFVSNDSDLTDFTSTDEESENVREILRREYSVDVSTLADERIVTLAKAIEEKRGA
jgi:hypothetical protein